MRNKILKNVGQKVANLIVDRISKSESLDELQFWYNIGMKLDIYLTVMHDIYLD